MDKKNYFKPESRIFHVEVEGVLCASGEDVTQSFNSLQDYEASEGAW